MRISAESINILRLVGMALTDFEPNLLCDSKHHRQTYVSLAASIGMLTVGSIIAWTSTALPNLKSSSMPGLNLVQEGWIGSLVPLGALIAGPIAGYTLDVYGRKPIMILTGGFAMFGWILISIATKINELYVGRFITGLALGSFVIIIPIYISEISDKEIRGALSTIAQATSILAQLISFLAGSILSWKWTASISTTFPILFIMLGILLPESPRFLIEHHGHDHGHGHNARHNNMNKNNNNEAKKVLAWLRNKTAAEEEDDDEIELELNQIRESTTELKSQIMISSSIKIKISNLISKPLLICMALMIFQQLTGHMALLFYMVEIFQVANGQQHHQQQQQHGSSSSSSFDNANINTIITGGFMIMFLGLSILLMDMVGRKPLLLGSAIAITIAQLINGFYMYLLSSASSSTYNSNTAMVLQMGSWIPLICILVFFGAYAIGFGPIPWIIMSEILPNHMKGIAASVTSSTHFITGFIVTKYFHSLSTTLGLHWTFWLFSACSAVSIVFIIVCVPETKLKSLEEIQLVFNPVINVDNYNYMLTGNEDDEITPTPSTSSANNYSTFDNPGFTTTTTETDDE